MKKLLSVIFVALLLAGCGGVEKSGSDDNESALAPPVADPQKIAVVDKWAEWEADPEPYGGLEVLAKIKEAEESGATELDLGGNETSDLSPLNGLTNLNELELWGNEITDVSPLAGLTNLEKLHLGDNQISDLSPLKGLTKLEKLWLDGNQITDLSPL
jgi:Leucine-rich repeat (LRR) protein